MILDVLLNRTKKYPPKNSFLLFHRHSKNSSRSYYTNWNNIIIRVTYDTYEIFNIQVIAMKVNKIEKTADNNVKISNVIVPRFTILPDKICTKQLHKNNIIVIENNQKNQTNNGSIKLASNNYFVNGLSNHNVFYVMALMGNFRYYFHINFNCFNVFPDNTWIQ